MMNRSALLPPLALLALAGCADGPFSAPAAPVAVGIHVAIEQDLLTTGDSTAFTLRVLGSDGRVMESLPVWAVPAVTTSDGTILESRSGRVVAVGSGLAEVIAEAGGMIGRAPVRVNPRTLTLEAASVTLNQAVQRLDGGVPLLAGRPGLLQVFVAADRVNFFDRPTVRVRLFQGAEEVSVVDVRPDGLGVPHRPLEDGVSFTWNVPVAGALVRPGLGVLVELDPHDELPHASPDRQRLFPASGEPLRFTFQTVPPFRVRFVPVHSEGVGTAGVTPNNVDRYLEAARLVFPLDEVDRDVRAVYSTPTHANSDENWLRLISEIGMLRTADGSSRYYVGLARPGGGSPGRGTLGYPVSVSHDELPGAAWTVAHELGHNFDRLHPPCGHPADNTLDFNFPYPAGSIGVFGYDPRTQQLHDRSSRDLMSYCGPWWVSDVTYEAVFAFRRREAERAAAAAQLAAGRARVPTLLLWGRVGRDGPHLEPAFEIETLPALPTAPGAYTLEGRDEHGAVLFSHSFEPTPVTHDAENARSFAFALPLDFPRDRLASIRLRGKGRSAVLRAALPAAERAHLRATGRSLAGEQLTRRRPGEVEVRWNPALHPAALVLDPRTGEVVGLARGGTARIPSDAPELELRLSDGVSSVVRRLTAP